MSSENVSNYDTIASKVKKELRTIKREYFLKFCNSLNKNISMSYVWNKVKAISNSYYRKEDSHVYKEKNRVAVFDAINDLCSPWSEVPPPDFSCLPVVELFEMPFDVSELDAVLHGAKVKSCPGMDGIDYFVLKNLTTTLKKCLLKIMNEIYFTGSFPKEWEEFLIFFIPKKDSDKLRPISLAQTTLKILEKMLYYRLYWWIEFKKVLPKSQFGFRRNSSCSDNLAILSANVKYNSLRNKDTAAVFLDIKGAYDNVLCDVLMNKLISINISRSAIRFIYNVIHKRVVTVRYNDIECVRTCYKGLPQGSVLSPLLYSIYVADLESFVDPNAGIKIIQFADDICLFCSKSNTKDAVKKLENKANEVDGWLAKVFVYLKRKHNYASFTQIATILKTLIEQNKVSSCMGQ